MEIWLRALQRYLQPNREDRQRGVASADVGAGLVGGHTATSGVAGLKTQVAVRSERAGVSGEGPIEHQKEDAMAMAQRLYKEGRLTRTG